jgi:hypothetical protein
MKTRKHDFAVRPLATCLGLALWCSALLITAGARAGTGTNWTALDKAPSDGGGVETMFLLTDGTVMAQNGGSTNWYRLTPDRQGSYVHGEWTNRQSMTYTRLYYASAVLPDGRLFVAGAEYGTGWGTSEVYDPVADHWREIAVPPGLVVPTNSINTNSGVNSGGFLDSGCVLLPDGRVLISPVSPAASFFGGTVIFDPVANSFSAGPTLANGDASTDEQSWVKLPDDSVLSFDGALKAQRYIPSLNQWIPDHDVPLQLYDAIGGEVGAGLLLPNGNAFFLGANGNTLVYKPTGNTNFGAWTIGPVIPGGQGAPDAAAAMMVNGKILCALSGVPTVVTNIVSGVPTLVTNKFPVPTSFYEYDYSVGSTGALTQVDSPRGSLTNAGPTFNTRMLALPDGTILFSDGGSQLFVYQPSTPPLAAGKPHISSITPNGNGSYHLTGTLLNGISVGAAYGDDVQMDSNYPLVRVTDGTGNVFYLPTYNWSSTGVQTGNKLVSTEFFAFQGLTPALSYSLVAVANGISSDPVTFYGPVWVDLNSPDPAQTGSFDFPYHTLAQGISAVPNTGTINFKTAGSIPLPSPLPLTKPMSIVAIGGPVTIGP